MAAARGRAMSRCLIRSACCVPQKGYGYPPGKITSRWLSASANRAPVALVVSVEIKPDRIDEFLTAMRADVHGSRRETGCLRFDLLQDPVDPTKFVFYEVYRDGRSVARHKEQPHYKVWSDFRASGGVVSQSVRTLSAIDFSG
eukprot:gnl/TRDRNA2_/TRDRNA2_41295_c0_seq1.p1 gnl/TRDRNA2_/TRDRNA2_41295_c0~~gnl/TRDRNA2_/TRDRNA2_41295_c0_seq1.p1  ORF type:complete len:143 (-),score=21.13 gnl/TRDRNA2_/TRDRNA2_41295_c0_seq1:68-496(-)